MMRQRVLSFLLPAFLGLVAWSTLYGQSEWLPEDATPIQRQFIDAAGSQLQDYWNPKLNEYKRSIDQMLSPNDLQQLNAMRVRWSILMDKLSQQMTQKVSVDEDGEEMDFSFDSDKEDGFMEIMEIWTNTMSLSTAYRSGLDNMSDNVIEDVGGFTDRMASFMDEFAQLHQAELQGDEKGQELLAHRNEVADGLRGIRKTINKENKGFVQVYTLAVEPLIMLYNGGDLGDILPFISSQTSSADLGAVAGLLPKGGVLQQNYPNPASAKTTIPFTLSQPSSEATLRIYSADGGLVETVELGAFQSGSHTHEIDVSTFAPGSYLYHLTLATDGGETVYSKVMQVVR
ncbi:MAG: T9SS type A sorting domain-containing protein [Ignavibacteriae bacterium]|nr:T9SS type A sorting domain-containing protein [Ignavibacteriota bacterium]MCB9214712.1 T9SS type A sorting domain-containing protein [Ignavibacteria bacterium]